jgi:hypothetical protein
MKKIIIAFVALLLVGALYFVAPTAIQSSRMIGWMFSARQQSKSIDKDDVARFLTNLNIKENETANDILVLRGRATGAVYGVRLEDDRGNKIGGSLLKFSEWDLNWRGNANAPLIDFYSVVTWEKQPATENGKIVFVGNTLSGPDFTVVAIPIKFGTKQAPKQVSFAKEITMKLGDAVVLPDGLKLIVSGFENAWHTDFANIAVTLDEEIPSVEIGVPSLIQAADKYNEGKNNFTKGGFYQKLENGGVRLQYDNRVYVFTPVVVKSDSITLVVKEGQ